MIKKGTDCMEIGTRIRGLREMHRMTREQLAEKIDISSKFLYEIESGRCSFNIVILIHLSDVFCVSTDYLLFGKTGQPPPDGIEETIWQMSVEEKERIRYILREILRL